MSVHMTLAAIARGERPAELLHTCRLTTDRGEAYGIAAVSAHFQDAPLVGDSFGNATNPALACGETMLIADAHDGHVIRIWRAGPGGALAGESRVDVAFDPDMAQAGGDVFASTGDFPSVSGEVLDRIVAAGCTALADGTLSRGRRSRLFLLRVTGDETTQVALFAHHMVAPPDRADGGFALVAVLLDDDTVRWFADAPAARGWTPRL